MHHQVKGTSPVHLDRPVQELVEIGDYQRIYDQGVGEKESWYINDHCIIRDHSGRWHMFGITNKEPLNPFGEKVLAHAIADELTQSPWQKQPFAVTVDQEEWREVHLWAPCVVFHEGLYHMYICVGGETSETYRIHLLTSKDLRNWTRHAENPMLVDGYDARDPHIIRLADGRWVMYYTATSEPNGGNHIVATVESTDLVHWTNRRVVYTDVEEGTFGGCTESPFVVCRGSVYYLFICNNDRRRGYDATDVYRSEDPFSFNPDDWVGAISGHAMEVIQDVDGKWYATHCGWGRGGLYLAPLHWHDNLD